MTTMASLATHRSSHALGFLAIDFMVCTTTDVLSIFDDNTRSTELFEPTALEAPFRAAQLQPRIRSGQSWGTRSGAGQQGHPRSRAS